MSNLTSRLVSPGRLRCGWPGVARSPVLMVACVARSPKNNLYRSFSDHFRPPPGVHGGGGGGRGGGGPRGRRGDGMRRGEGHGRGTGALSRFLQRQGQDWGQRQPREDKIWRPSGMHRPPLPTIPAEATAEMSEYELEEDDDASTDRESQMASAMVDQIFDPEGNLYDSDDDIIDDDIFVDSDDDEDDDDEDVENWDEDDDAEDAEEKAMKGFNPGRYDGKYYHDEIEADEFDGSFIEDELELMRVIGVERFEEFRKNFIFEVLKNYTGKEYHDKFLDLMYMFYVQDGKEIARMMKTYQNDDEDIELPANLQDPSGLIKITAKDEEDAENGTNNISPHEMQQMEDDFFFDEDDENFVKIRKKGDPDFSLIDPGVSPLADHGPDIDDFLQEMEYHPSEFAEIKRVTMHPDSLREPRPDFPKNRRNPPLEFVTSHVRFMFVTDLPTPEVKGEDFSIDNPLHQLEIKKLVARIGGFKLEQVSPASNTTAFVGFKTVVDFEELRPPEPIRPTNITLNLFRADSELDDEFTSLSPDSIIEIHNLPSWVTAEKLVTGLFPNGSALHETFGDLASGDVLVKAPGMALVRLKSKDLALQALQSEIFNLRLSELGERKVKYFKARRELVRDRFVKHANELRVLGPRLIVDGDVPSRKFFISHADTIQVRNLDLSLTKEEISDFFQTFCSDPRDYASSIEYVTCTEGRRTGKAYIGFDRQGEVEKVFQKFPGRVKIGNRVANMKLVKDRLTGKERPPRESRPNRTIEELLQDLNDWERHANPEDLKALVNAGMSKEILGDMFRNLRFRNATFASLDQAKSDERLTQNRPRGHDYRELVRNYITTLKECIATPEDPGQMFLGQFERGEEVDLSAFVSAKAHQARILEKRRKWYGED